ERITKTKRSKNDQKPTRNERDKKKSEETTKDQSRINPTQKERKSKTPIMTSVQRFKGHLEVLKIQGLNLTKGERCLLKKKREISTTRAKPAILKPYFTLERAE
ncbi:hypothetical protein Tco_1199115, partial [Tanacetum coccineum]